MLDIIMMLFTILVMGFVIREFLKKRKDWIRYLSKIGKGTKKKIPEEIITGAFPVIAAVSLLISIGVSLRMQFENPVLKGLFVLLTGEIISVLLVLSITCIFITIKEIGKVNDRIVNGILLYTFLMNLFQILQYRQEQMEYIECGLLINGISYLFNVICIFHITGKTFEKVVSVKNVWSTMMINMAFIIVELSSMVYQVQRLGAENCFNLPIDSFPDSVYYVLISFFTVGYGDLYPIDLRAKAVSLVIVITGFLFTAVFFGMALSVTTEKIQHKQEQKKTEG